ncbi:DUF1205 domain-containing protein [Saccharopolyspora erythraea]|uniref:nucleotide disphospho-sugar-binding domain-containing protein n=1 Tax=Saccharopolyspora erythraea TaxID=1836 RepID=UPI001BACAA00|nr:nucleotide disphospho-sugar-binding domain-containing protein [Saccharopolyspora erythraea]QUH04272.1 DUF1205 domain-containing protein [Saccharopolyspora erythraea]
MRVLFTTTPGRGHFFPMVPLAWALRCAGHQVLVAAPPQIAESVRAAGLEHVPVGGGAPDAGRYREFTAEPWAVLAEHAVDETADLVARWFPDLVVCDYAELAGPVAAAVHEVPAVSHHWGLHLSDESVRRLFSGAAAIRLRRLHARFGLSDKDAAPELVVDLCPPSLARFDRRGWLPMRHIPYGGAGIPPPWLWEPRDRPRICVSMGGVPAEVVHETMRGLACAEAEIVLTGSDVPADLPGVRAVGWLPHDQLLPTCDAVVHHGGSGTAMNSLLCGLPQLVLPHAGEQFENAERLVAAGVARQVGRGERDARTLGAALEQLLEDPSYRDRALRVRSEIESMPAPGEVVLALEAHAESPPALTPIR